MSNHAIWNVRLRHEWLSHPKKKVRMKKRSTKRLGMRELPEKGPKAETAEQG
ncbi:MAG: hypothetical protein IT373_08835 [Polyangiaceae bacterium]|nr:hypothetical protein [Polyangiaceae bacterium]